MECKETKVTAKYVIKRSKAPVDEFFFLSFRSLSPALLCLLRIFFCTCFVSSSTFKIITFQLFLFLSQLTTGIFMVDCDFFADNALGYSGFPVISITIETEKLNWHRYFFEAEDINAIYRKNLLFKWQKHRDNGRSRKRIVDFTRNKRRVDSQQFMSNSGCS